MLKRTLIKTLLASTLLVPMGFASLAQDAFDGPTTGPAAAEGKSIVVLAGDLKPLQKSAGR
jgi:ribose transport system substrate-binding protein